MSRPRTHRRLIVISAVAALLLSLGGCPGSSGDFDPADPNAVIAGVDDTGGGGGDVILPGGASGGGGSSGFGGGSSDDDAYDGESPVVDDLGLLTPPDTPVEIELSGTSPTDEPLEFEIVSPPVHGTLSGLESVNEFAATVTYTPPAGFRGRAQFSYRASDGVSVSNLGTVIVVVYPAVHFELDVYEGAAPLTVVGAAYTMTGGPLLEGDYRWNWGDGEEGGPVDTFGQCAHTYERPGTYSVGLSILLAGLSQSVACTHVRDGKETLRGAVQVGLAISGQVRDDEGKPLAGVTLATDDGLDASTDADGRYVLHVPEQWSGVVTPSRAGYTFAPASRTYDKVTENRPGQDYVGFASGQTAILVVAPAGDFESSGDVGGPFAPASKTYTLSNEGNRPLSWTASATQEWVTLSSTGGTLAPGGSVTVAVSIDQDTAAALEAGSYDDTITFTNTTSGEGDTTRAVELTVTAPSPPTLVVTPADGLTSNGPPGGPFDPESKAYTLTNTGEAALDWTAAATQNWTTVSPPSGTLAAGASIQVTVTIDADAESLPEGAHGDTVTFANGTNGAGTTNRGVSLVVTAIPHVSNSVIIGVWYQSGDPATIAKWKSRGVNTFIGPPSVSGVWDVGTFCANLAAQEMEAITLGTDAAASRMGGDANYHLRPDYDGYPSPAGDPAYPGFGAWIIEPDEPDLDVHIEGYPCSPLPGCLDSALSKSMWIDRANYLAGLAPTALKFGNFTGSSLRLVHFGPEYHNYVGWYETDIIEMIEPLDIVGEDAYPVNRVLPMSYLKEVLDAISYQAAAAGNKRFLVFIESSCQNFSIPGTRAPTPAEFRGEIWLALIYGATGICFFPQVIYPPFPPGYQGDGTPPDLVAEMTSQNALIRTYEEVLLSPGALTIATPFYERVVVHNGTTYSFILNYSDVENVYNGQPYGPYEVKFLTTP